MTAVTVPGGQPERHTDCSESAGIVDSTGEAWLFHVLTGPGNSSAVWAARRIPEKEVGPDRSSTPHCRTAVHWPHCCGARCAIHAALSGRNV